MLGFKEEAKMRTRVLRSHARIRCFLVGRRRFKSATLIDDATSYMGRGFETCSWERLRHYHPLPPPIRLQLHRRLEPRNRKSPVPDYHRAPLFGYTPSNKPLDPETAGHLVVQSCITPGAVLSATSDPDFHVLCK